VRLEAPELFVVHQVVEMLGERGHAALVSAGFFELFDRALGGVL